MSRSSSPSSLHDALPAEVAIRIAHLSKRYALGSPVRRYDTLRDHLAEGLRSVVRRGFRSPEPPAHWALRDVSFEVQRGEVVGIIGSNGAGKSTLLKILARVTTPTDGCARIRGRLGALLEVGTGFHPELTGRENVLLNGAILGMKRAEVVRKFDAIVAFSELERFIDTPVKHYSSGMYVRLAFAVAAHLEPDILVVDEALAVGDFAFQRKCLGQLQNQRGSGRTVLFVSHNLGAIRRLCTRCVLLQSGQVVLDGPADDVIDHYVEQQSHQHAATDSGLRRPDVGDGFLLHLREPIGDRTIFCGDPIALDFDIESFELAADATVGIGIRITGSSGEPIVSMDSVVQRAGAIRGEPRLWNVHCELGRLPLNAGTYFVWVSACVYVEHTVKRFAQFSNALAIHVLEHDVFGWGASLPRPRYWGPMYWTPQWRIRPADPSRRTGAGRPAVVPAVAQEDLACQDCSGS